ncbi:MAG: hypothetical protein FGM46_07525 [Ferruginibacter sp.]|nr:hypothetical protein [Ferruginibacter sp.]
MKKRKIHEPGINPIFTYIQNRKCEHCDAPIEDQARASKRHCASWVDEFGIKHDCKRQKHADKHSREDEFLQALNAGVKDNNKKIDKMVAEKGNVVTTEVINAYGIELTKCVDFEFDGRIFKSQFLNYYIYSNPISQTHKIERYE